MRAVGNGMELGRSAGCGNELSAQGTPQARVTADMRAPAGAVRCMRVLADVTVF